jgi:hypothetical protein
MTEDRQAEDRRYAAIKRVGKTAPETVGQALHWQTAFSHYLADGLCHRCASQAAWGHQNGFSLIRPPCDACQPIVDTFPVAAGANSPWRKFPTAHHRPVNVHLGDSHSPMPDNAVVRTGAALGQDSEPLSAVGAG